MKSSSHPSHHIRATCLLLSWLAMASTVQASSSMTSWWSFSWFGNLLAMHCLPHQKHECEVGGPKCDLRCNLVHCEGPLAPKWCREPNAAKYCAMTAGSGNYDSCVAGMNDANSDSSYSSDSSSQTNDGDAHNNDDDHTDDAYNNDDDQNDDGHNYDHSYYEYKDSSTSEYDSSTWGGSDVYTPQQSTRKFNWLPYIIIGAVTTSLLLLWVWKARRDDQKRKEDELNASNNLHGALAKGFTLDRAPTTTSFISTATGDSGDSGFESTSSGESMAEPTPRSTTYAMMMV